MDFGTVGSLCLTLLPIVVFLGMVIIWKKSSDISSVLGWLVISVVAVLFFKISLEVIGPSTLEGFLKSFPVTLITATSLFQMVFMEKTGALKSVVIFSKTIASNNKAMQVMMISMGFCSLMLIKVVFVFSLILAAVAAVLTVTFVKHCKILI